MKNNFKIIFGCYLSYVSSYFANLLVIKHNIHIDSILISHEKNDTHLSLLHKSITVGSELFRQFTENIDITPVPQSE